MALKKQGVIIALYSSQEKVRFWTQITFLGEILPVKLSLVVLDPSAVIVPSGKVNFLRQLQASTYFYAVCRMFTMFMSVLDKASETKVLARKI